MSIIHDHTNSDPFGTANPLHAQLMPLLHTLLAADAAPARYVVLDLAGGDGDKLPMLRSVYGPCETLVTLDREPWHGENPRRSLAHPLTADAHALPLQEASLDRVVCVAAFGLFADQRQVLREIHRALKPGGRLLVISATQHWAQVTHWPEAARVAYQHVLRSHNPFAEWDIAEQLAQPLQAAGFGFVQTRAFLLDQTDPFQAEMTLLPWSRLAPLLAAHLDVATLEECAQRAVETDVELCSLVLAAWAER